MTRAIVVLSLVAALSFAARSFLPSDVTITGSGAALAFGFLLLAALQSGHIFHALKLPHLTGFILCGAIFGPEVLGLLTHAMLDDLVLVKKVAVGLIALTAGCELNFRNLRPKIKSIGIMSACSLFLAAVLLFGFLFFISGRLEFTAGMTIAQRAVIALICTNVLSALSPAVVMGILSETRAGGALSELCLSIAVLADLAIAVSFSFSDSAARAVFPQPGAEHSVFGALAAHILGSLAVGAGAGVIFALYIRRVASRVGLFVFAVCFVIAEAGGPLHLDPLLVGLSAGLFLENVSPVSGHEVIHETQVAAMPTYAVFFAVIGAQVHLRAFLTIAPYAVAAAVVRAIGIHVGAVAGGRLAKLDRTLARRVSSGMLPQAGIAIGLAGLLKQSFPLWGDGAATLILSTILVNQLLGPILFRAALVRAGEVGQKQEEPYDVHVDIAEFDEVVLPARPSLSSARPPPEE